MKNYTTSQKIVIFFGYLIALLTFAYFCNLGWVTVKSILEYEATSGPVATKEKIEFLLFDNIHLVVMAMTLAFATKIYSLLTFNKKTKVSEHTQPKEAPKTSDKKAEVKKEPAKKNTRPAKKMTLQEVADKIGISKDRVYRYFKASEMSKTHKDESPIMITTDEFKAIKAHFSNK